MRSAWICNACVVLLLLFVIDSVNADEEETPPVLVDEVAEQVIAEDIDIERGEEAIDDLRGSTEEEGSLPAHDDEVSEYSEIGEDDITQNEAPFAQSGDNVLPSEDPVAPSEDFVAPSENHGTPIEDQVSPDEDPVSPSEDLETHPETQSDEVRPSRSVDLTNAFKAAQEIENNGLLQQARELLQRRRKRSGDVRGAVSILDTLAERNHPEALYLLGALYEGGDGDAVIRNATRAEEYYLRAAESGHEHAQAALGFLYATGLGVPVDEMKSLLYLHFAAIGGSTDAQMALGYRYAFGHGVQRQCETAAEYYNQAAEKVVEYVQKPENSPVLKWPRLSDDRDMSSEKGEDDEVIQYIQFSADHGNVENQMRLGTWYYWGFERVPQNATKAFQYFEMAAKEKDVSALSNVGHMYIHGIGVEQNNATGLDYFRRAMKIAHDVLTSSDGKIKPDDSAALNGLGYCYLYGHGVPISYADALENFKLAAEKGNPDAQFNLGTMYAHGIGTAQNYPLAFQYFRAASLNSHTLALYNVAVMNLRGQGTPKDCLKALPDLKRVAERGPWAHNITLAVRAFISGDVSDALLRYVHAAEQGYEAALSSAGWLFDRGPVSKVEQALGIPPPIASFSSSSNATRMSYRELLQHERLARALKYYLRAAEQNNLEAQIRAGDLYYFGMGTPVRYDMALTQYRSAGKEGQSRHPQALYNVGYMYEYGLGVRQDFNLAKRFYDMSLHSHPDAYAPCALALARLWLHIKWNALRNYNFQAILNWSWGDLMTDPHVQAQHPQQQASHQQQSTGTIPKDSPGSLLAAVKGALSGGLTWVEDVGRGLWEVVYGVYSSAELAVRSSSDTATRTWRDLMIATMANWDTVLLACLVGALGYTLALRNIQRRARNPAVPRQERT
mmetsp:Transcript_19319/g.31640  ORF Transcript_19319/g.31640 Transcript_19319/m.31640 type:complete len:899 (-) Transcript_19319:54-2750(-)|eukprot:CAMPEP_0184646958 /NCGR_PEP_ID=MMETSP0308-20130426/3784_1 /TAXON_ID=38269 /ORGANISM="Gloeochaete witrockiana, Strain SAG 46.84" /LENGTH=898 /DNA_ID=CAMNT_0027077487 /DNA_START=30 /DNA_END=2726 /DNA_ORIENTATION=+